jgi:hypothetical protein
MSEIDKAKTVDIGVAMQDSMGYWEVRKHFLYYKAVFQYLSVVGYDAKRIIDVGSANAEYLSWASWIPDRSILDFKISGKFDGITAIETDFFEFYPEEKYDVALCCQVLEHVPDPRAFCEKLKNISRRLIITVPYKWQGYTPGHIHDPVDEVKLDGWMGCKPNFSQVIYEPFREARLIAYYDIENGVASRFEKKFIFEAIAKRASFIKI